MRTSRARTWTGKRARGAERVASQRGIRAADVALSLVKTRAQHDSLAAIIGTDLGAFAAGLRALADGQPAPNVVQGIAGRPGKTAFVCSGQGSQRAGMGQGLHARFPVFATALDDVCAHLDPHLDRPLRQVMFAEPGTAEAALLDQTMYTQPALFALQVGLYRLAGPLRLAPDPPAGHSPGGAPPPHPPRGATPPDAPAPATPPGPPTQ